MRRWGARQRAATPSVVCSGREDKRGEERRAEQRRGSRGRGKRGGAHRGREGGPNGYGAATLPSSVPEGNRSQKSQCKSRAGGGREGAEGGGGSASHHHHDHHHHHHHQRESGAGERSKRHLRARVKKTRGRGAEGAWQFGNRRRAAALGRAGARGESDALAARLAPGPEQPRSRAAAAPRPPVRCGRSLDCTIKVTSRGRGGGRIGA